MRLPAYFAATLAAVCATGGGLHAHAASPPAQSATVIGPSNPQLSDGATALEAGRVEEGIRLTLDGLQSPNNADDRAAGHSNLCAGYAMLKQWEQALQHCNTALSIDGKNWRTLNNRAAVYSARAQFDLAMKDIRAGLEIAPNSSTLRESLRIIQENRRLLSTKSRSSLRPP
jgi:tetratricopeptide (TPR) repeat protein